MVAHDTTAQQIYDPETGAWDGQTAFPGMPPLHSLPDLDNTVKTLFFWAMDLEIPHGPRLALLTILRHISWEKGDRCTAGIQTLAKEAQFSRKTLKRHIKYLVDAELISRFPHIGRTTETRLGMAGVETTPTAGVETTPMAGVAATPETNSSSTNSINQYVPSAVDAKNGETRGPETETKTGFNSFSIEEERTGTGVTVKDAEAWEDLHLSETPEPFEVEQLGTYLWPAWGKHWSIDLAGAIVVWTKTPASRRKFRKDAVMHLVTMGLPVPQEPDAEDQAAREQSAAWMDRSIAGVHQRMVDVKCAGCWRLRQLPPGETHCYTCRKALVGVAA